MAQHITVTGHYNRDYTSKAKVLADWENGKDFRVESFGPHMGRAVSIREARELDLHVTFRYSRLTKAFTWKPGD